MSKEKGDEFSALEEAERLLQEAIRHQAGGDSQWAEDALVRALDIYRRVRDEIKSFIETLPKAFYQRVDLK